MLFLDIDISTISRQNPVVVTGLLGFYRTNTPTSISNNAKVASHLDKRSGDWASHRRNANGFGADRRKPS